MKTNKLTLILFFVSLAALNQSVAQTQSSRKTITREVSEEYSPLRPENGRPFIFSSEKEKEEAKQKKSLVIKEEIKNSLNDPKRVKILREDLWRIENAIIKSN